MNFEHVSVENRQKHRQSYLPGFEESTIFSSPCPDSDQNHKPTKEIQTTNPEIMRILQRHSDRCLSGYEHVKQYLWDLHRRNCRPNTIRSNGTTIILFLTFCKSLGRQQIQDINRQDVSAFIEYEQDRGMTPNTVSTRSATDCEFRGGVIGSRFGGGRFGGCVIGLVATDRAVDVARDIRDAYLKCHPEAAGRAAVYLTTSADGVRFL